MKRVNIHEAKTHLSRLVDEAAEGKPFIIAKAGKPLVKVVALDAPTGKRSYTLFSADQRIHYRNGGAAATQTDPTVEMSANADAAGGPPQASLEEAYALRDLRHAASAERIVSAMIGRGYVNPERLAEQTAYQGAKLPPMVPGYFVQAIRQGYKFEFSGTNAMRAPTPFGQAYEAFVYSAVPQGPRSRRRAFALYADGKIYANADGQVPTQNDTLVEGR